MLAQFRKSSYLCRVKRKWRQHYSTIKTSQRTGQLLQEIMKKATSITRMYEYVIVGLASNKTFNCHQAIEYLKSSMKPNGIDLTPTPYNCSYKTRFEEKAANLFKHSDLGHNVLVNCGLVTINKEHSLMTITKAGRKAYMYRTNDLLFRLRAGDYKGVLELVNLFLWKTFCMV